MQEAAIRGTLILAGLIGLGILADAVLNQGAGFLFLSRKVIDLALYMTFWRH